MRSNRYGRSPFKRHLKNGLRIENKGNDEATVYIYDEISWWGVSSDEFVKELQAIDASTIHLRLNSPGGSVFDGTAIYNALKQHTAKVIVHVDGLAASIASIIAMAGDEVHMGEGSYMMIHDPWSIMIGTAEDFRAEAELLDKVGGTIAGIYSKRSKKDEKEIKEMMANETWLTADEAVEAGLADKVDSGKAQQAKNLFDLSVFANVPDALREGKGAPTPRDMEQALRDVGCSHTMAKAILAKGYQDGLRDEVTDLVTEPAEPQRDVEPKQVKSKDRTAELLIQAELLAPKLAA